MKKILKELKNKGIEHIFFIGATIFSAGIHFIYSIFVKIYVQPLEYGMYSTCMLLQTYMAYLQLGTLNAFNRDYPQLIGSKNLKKAEQYRNTIFSFLLSIYSVAILLVITIFILIGKKTDLDNRLTIGFIFSSIITFMTIIENYGNYRCRIDKGFNFSSIVTIMELLSIPLGMYLMSKFGYYAIYITSIIAMVIGIVLYYKPSYRDFKFLFDKTILKIVLISGAPLLVNGLIWTIVNSIDKFVILKFIDTKALGIYGIAQNAFSYMVLIPSAMSQLFYVKMGKEFGISKKKRTLIDISIKYTTILACITSFIALVAYFFLPVLVNTFMPHYNNGIIPAQILILGLSIYAATLINSNILTILRQNTALLINSVCMCIFNMICSITYIHITGPRIESVALGTATSYIFCTFIIIYQIYKCTNYKIFNLVKASVIPVCISLVPGIIIYQVINNKILGFILSVVLVMVFYLIFYKKTIKKVLKEII